MRFTNDRKQNSIVFNYKAILGKLVASSVCCPFFLVLTEKNDISSDVEVCLEAFKRLLMNSHVSLVRGNVTISLSSVSKVFMLPIVLPADWSTEKAAPRLTASQKQSYHSHRISLILLPTFSKCLMVLLYSAFLGPWKPYHICIQLVMAIVLHSDKTLLCPVADS